jgi:hypothetical protein
MRDIVRRARRYSAEALSVFAAPQQAMRTPDPNASRSLKSFGS